MNWLLITGLFKKKEVTEIKNILFVDGIENCNVEDLIYQKSEFLKTAEEWKKNEDEDDNEDDNENEDDNFLNITGFTKNTFIICRNLFRNPNSVPSLKYEKLLEVVTLIDFLLVDDNLKLTLYKDLIYKNLKTPNNLDFLMDKLTKDEVEKLFNLNIFRNVRLVYKNNLAYFMPDHFEIIQSAKNQIKNTGSNPFLILTCYSAQKVKNFKWNELQMLDFFLKYHKIKEIFIINYQINDKFIENLSALENVSKITYKTKNLKRLPKNINILKNINDLTIQFDNSDDKYYKNLDKLKNLESLEIIKNGVYWEFDISVLSKMNYLRKLKLSHVVLEEKDLNSLLKTKNFDKLHLKCFGDFDKSINLRIIPDVEIVCFRVATDKEKADHKEKKSDSGTIVLKGTGFSLTFPDFPAQIISYNYEYLKLFIVVKSAISLSRNETDFSKKCAQACVYQKMIDFGTTQIFGLPKQKEFTGDFDMKNEELYFSCVSFMISSLNK